MPFLAAVSAGAAVAKTAGISFKAPTPRTYGRLPGTLRELQEGIEGGIANLNNRSYTDVETADLIGKSADLGPGSAYWREALPTYRTTQAALARLRSYDPNFNLTPGAATPAPNASPSAISQALDPLRAALDSGASEAELKDAAAQVVERVGVGGGAAGARVIRGTSGPLDTLIEFSQKPGGTLTLVVAGVALVALVGFWIGRR